MFPFSSLFSTFSSVAWSLSRLAASYADESLLTKTYQVLVTFQLDGTVDVFRAHSSNLLNEETYVAPDSGADGTWVRCTHQSGDDMTSGASRGVWHQCNAQRQFVMSHNSSGGDDQISGTFDFELASDSAGVSIVAQKLGVTVRVGEFG